MKVLRCQIEDLPNHIAAIESYTHFFNIDIVQSGIRENMIRFTKEAYHNPDNNVVPTKLVDDTGNAVHYLLFYHGKTKPVAISKGGVLTEYGKEHYKAMDLFAPDIIKSYLELAFNKDTTEFLVYQRMARSRFSNRLIKRYTEPGMPLEGWKVRVIAEIPPYGLIQDEALAQWVVGRLNGLVPERMTITQLTKIS